MNSGRMRATDFFAEAGGAFLIAVTCGRAEARVAAALPIDYWALGGRTDRKTLFTEPRTAHYPGTPQGRRPADVGPHGCTMVEVQASRQVRLRFIPCDAVRWQHERILVSPVRTWDDLVAKLAERIQDMRAQTPAIRCWCVGRWLRPTSEGLDGVAGTGRASREVVTQTGWRSA